MAEERRRGKRTLLPFALTMALVAVYSAVLVWVGPTSHVEKFPVFKWQLFSKVPSEVSTSFGVRLLYVDGFESETPPYFEESLFPFAKSPEASTLIKAWGQHLVAGRSERAEQTQLLFESRFISSATVVHYQVVERRYDVIDRVACGCYVSEEVVGEFRYG